MVDPAVLGFFSSPALFSVFVAGYLNEIKKMGLKSYKVNCHTAGLKKTESACTRCTQLFMKVILSASLQTVQTQKKKSKDGERVLWTDAKEQSFGFHKNVSKDTLRVQGRVCAVLPRERRAVVALAVVWEVSDEAGLFAAAVDVPFLGAVVRAGAGVAFGTGGRLSVVV